MFADSQMSENALNHVEKFLQRLRGKPNGERRVQKGTARYEREHAIILPTVFRTSFLLRVSPERDPSEKIEVALKVTQHEQQCRSAATVSVV